MRNSITTVCFLLFRAALFGQSLMDFDYPLINNGVSFFGNNYDTALLRKNKVESCVQLNDTFYFDYNGRVIKNTRYQSYDSSTQVNLFRYDAQGRLSEIENLNSRYQPFITRFNRFFREFKNGFLIKDSSTSGFLCKHMEYYNDGNLRQELWFGADQRFGLSHTLQKGFWFGLDNLRRINQIIERDYMERRDSFGKIVSNRTLFYNEKNQLVKEIEAVEWREDNEKRIFCPNAGSATYQYDVYGRIIEIERLKGPSQKITYLPNGLIERIETKGKNCEGRKFSWNLVYKYTYYE